MVVLDRTRFPLGVPAVTALWVPVWRAKPAPEEDSNPAPWAPRFPWATPMAMNFSDAFALTEKFPVIDPGSFKVPSTDGFVFSEQTPNVGLASADSFALTEAVVSGPGDSDSGTLTEATSLTVQVTDADTLALGETTSGVVLHHLRFMAQ